MVCMMHSLRFGMTKCTSIEIVILQRWYFPCHDRCRGKCAATEAVSAHSPGMLKAMLIRGLSPTVASTSCPSQLGNNTTSPSRGEIRTLPSKPG
eukprot:m.137675 g.137675  ORF g.137675 m.137675 type:complete len:94 (+) comp12132_c0_seq1:146-427(+)